MGKRKIGALSFLVRDYDEAIVYFTNLLGFKVTSDTDLGAGKRFVIIHPAGGEDGSGLVLAKPTSPKQIACIGRQGADRVMFFLHTDNFDQDYQTMKQGGVVFLEEPRHEEYGSVVVFEDLYGNRWDLLQPILD